MIKTRLTELLGIKYPIIQAGMGPFPTTTFASPRPMPVAWDCFPPAVSSIKMINP